MNRGARANPHLTFRDGEGQLRLAQGHPVLALRRLAFHQRVTLGNDRIADALDAAASAIAAALFAEVPA